MMTSQRIVAAPSRVGAQPCLSLRPAAQTRRRVIGRFQEDERPPLAAEQDVKQEQRRPTDTKLSTQQLEEIYNKEPGNISPRTAELRADLGTAVTDLSAVQAFDGPIPETVNGRLAMIGVTWGLVQEWVTGAGLLQQTADAPLRILTIGLAIAFASYAPVIKGYTRKEPFANTFAGLPWVPLVENWNGGLAMLGFTGMILTEAITGVNTLQVWGLQPTVLHAASVVTPSVGAGTGVL